MKFFVTDLREAAGKAGLLPAFVGKVGYRMDMTAAALDNFRQCRDLTGMAADLFLREHYGQLQPHLTPGQRKRLEESGLEVDVPKTL